MVKDYLLGARPFNRKFKMETKENNKRFSIIIYSFLSLFVCLYLEMFFEVSRGYYTQEYAGLITNTLTAGVILRVLSLFLAAAVLFFVFERYAKPLPGLIYRHRFLIAAIVVVIGVLLKLNGSSIGCWAPFLGDSPTDVLFGFPRAIRSDEWMVNLPTNFSQAYNSYAPISDILRGAATNVTLPLYAPSWSVATLFHPFSWVYLLLGSDYGLSFEWVASKVALFLVSFECAMLYTKKNKALSLAAAFMLSFSPLVVWWNANFILIVGQMLVICLYYYLRVEGLGKKVLFSALLAYFAGCYLMLLYPAWQVPFFFIFACMGVWVILGYRKDRRLSLVNKTFRPVRDLLVLLFCLAVLGLLIVSVFAFANDALQAMMSTAYPSGRVSTGGGLYPYLLNYLPSPFFALASPGTVFLNNACEDSAMFSLFPIGLVISCYVVFRKKDFLLAALVVLELVLLCYGLFGFPEWLSKATLLSYSVSYRIPFALGCIDILLLLRSLAILCSQNVSRSVLPHAIGKTLVLSVLVAIALCTLSFLIYSLPLILIQKVLMFMVVIVVIAEVFLLLATKDNFWQKMFTVSIGVFLLVTGICVNPIQIGSAPLTDNKLYNEVKNIAASEETLWITESTNTMGNLCIAAGAPTINNVNTYPDLNRWESLDPSHEYESTYNRYAHIVIELQSQHATSFTLTQADVFLVELNWNDLETLGVTHILSPNRLPSEPVGAVELTTLSQENGYYIYQVSYADNRL